MSHYDVDYSLLEGDAKREKALADLKEFWGEERYERFLNKCRAITEDLPTIFGFRLLLSFGGVEGYPVLALHEHLWPDRQDLRDKELVDAKFYD